MKKILVIDDDPDILEAVKDVLEMSGYDAEGSTNGDDIYNMIKEYKPDLIILDVLLSGNDGRVICKQLKMDKVNIPIIMMSAHPAAEDSVKLSGADAFVSKPFALDELLSEVQRLTAVFPKNIK